MKAKERIEKTVNGRAAVRHPSFRWVLMQFGLLGNLKGFDLVAGGRARQRRPRLEKHTGQDPEGVRYCLQM